jgi:NAD(P)-dependent dehydrogenase (short-subunit alcohol dehydrogenase family)
MKVLAVTGGGQGIGRAICLFFANEGYAVSIADTDAAAGREVVRMIERSGVPAQINRWVARTGKELGCPDVLVNNAGIGGRAPFLELKARDFDRVIAVSLRGAFLCSQGFARHMARRRKGGAIVNIASTRTFMSEAGTEAYTAAKGGIVALTHGMAISLGPLGIRVNSVSPGPNAEKQAPIPDLESRKSGCRLNRKLRCLFTGPRRAARGHRRSLPLPRRAGRLCHRPEPEHRRRHDRQDDLRGLTQLNN